MSDFTKGDVVQLKSGGPAMTVSTKWGDGRILCAWFDSAEKYQSQDFEPDSLKAYEPSMLTF